MKRISKVRPKSSQIRTDMDIKEQNDQTKNIHIVKYQDTQKTQVPTLLDCALLVINYISFLTNYLM